ncbi:MerR family transcriptional regulator [Clostridiales bacterium COT073_COT-073]|nr:MerR family transcriptional regulator [Clostridiales bacterium COT073_COT-073]
MLRNEIEKNSGLTRKAIEYYEEKGLIQPLKNANGYREYSEEDLKILQKVSTFRRLGLSISEISELIEHGDGSLSSVLRKKQREGQVQKKKLELLEKLALQGDLEDILTELSVLEREESIYRRLEIVFPGYFGQMFFAAYQPFLNEPLTEEGEQAFQEYITFLDHMPELNLTKEEQECIEKLAQGITNQDMYAFTAQKIKAIDNVDRWQEENKEVIAQYKAYKASEEYQNSLLKKIQDKLKNYMLESGYYAVAIPLLRKFSRSYDQYYQKMLEADERLRENK